MNSNLNFNLYDLENQTMGEIKRLEITDILQHTGNELTLLPLDSDRAMPIIECSFDEGLILLDREHISSYRRKEVVKYHGAVIKTGEPFNGKGMRKNDYHFNDPHIKNQANGNLMGEVIRNEYYARKGLPVEKIHLMIHDPLNGLLYSVETHKETLSDHAKNYDPLGQSDGVPEAIKEFFMKVNDGGYVFVPNHDRRGKIDLGDLLLSRDLSGRLEITASDNPCFVHSSSTAFDNSQTFMQVISSFYSRVNKNLKKKFRNDPAES